MREERKKKLTPVTSPKSGEMLYRKDLFELISKLTSETEKIIFPILLRYEFEYSNKKLTNDAYAQTLEEAFERLRELFNETDQVSKQVAGRFTKKVNQANKQRFYKSVENAVGVNLQTIIQRENLEDILIAKTRENVSLIKSIPDEYFKKLETMVFNSTTQGTQARSMIQQITEIGHSTKKRARFIARDQTSKLNSAINQQRQTNLGIEEYVWRDSGDGRVRPSHAANSGKTFKWDEPPANTGHPGSDPGCRCVAQAIIKIENLA